MMHLLPPNRSPLEARVAASHPLALPVPLRTLWNPATCPAELLPFLAWAFSVDVWEADWPEATKRAVIAESFAVHRIKGTRLAVEKALAAMGITVTLTEWFEHQPTTKPGTFRARLHLNDNREVADQLSGTFYQQIHHAIQSAKNLRSHYDFSLSAQFGPNRIGVASAQSAAGLARNDACPTQPPLELATGMVTVSTLQPASFSRAATRPVQPPLEIAGGMAVTAAHEACSFTRRAAQVTTDTTLSTARLAIISACRGLAVTRRLMANAPDTDLPASVAQANLPAASLLVAGACRGFAVTHHTMESTT
ncbi:phage tail protein I [Halomonas sp. KHS3]|uniref:phage tail protein I n=1 Tax=Halomonas sp. KHS3 TaxID=866350 RepID=UPI000697F324|nr:phage tail protein I [Halomonas sp. KHS3]